MLITQVDAKPSLADGSPEPSTALPFGERPALRFNWTRDEVRAIHDLPLLELVHRGASVHRQHHDPGEVQICKLISVKTGGCPEDCGYCSQSAHHESGIASEPMLSLERVLEMAQVAQRNGISRVCMGAAWREVRDDSQFEKVLEMVRAVTGLGLEVCCTLGLLTDQQAKKLEQAGLFAYNHNLDTSEEHYQAIITTRQYADRLKTLQSVRKTNITVCCGGIIGMGESVEDRLGLLVTLAGLRPHPESVPINLLAAVPGTPLAQVPPIPFFELLRVVATARILMPSSVVRLSAGRSQLSETEQAFCFLAGANSIFSSETKTMLTSAVPSPDYATDLALLNCLGLKERPPFKSRANNQDSLPSRPA